jgi:hypothetical protein
METILHREIEFRALTPRRTFEAASDEQALEILRLWFGGSQVVDEVLGIDTDAVADRQSVAYRFAGHGPDGSFVIEQRAYFSDRDGRIDWMRLLCSGFRAP